MRSSKHHREDSSRGISDHVLTLHQRLLHAINLALRGYNGKRRKLHCTDIETQRLFVRSFSTFLNSSSTETLQHSSVKESVPDLVRILVEILHLKNETILCMAANVAVKLVSILPNSMIQIHISDLVYPLSFLLSSHQLQVAISCAIGLRLILSKMSVRKEKEVWKILESMEVVNNIICNIQAYSSGTNPIENSIEMISLLSSILWRWTPSRFCVWNDAELMKVLEALFVVCDISVKFVFLQLYSSIVLCGHGAWKIFENGEVLQTMVHCMGDSYPVHVRIEGFKLAQCLAMTEERCLKLMSVCCEPLTKAIISAMGGLTSNSGKVGNEQMCLLVEACRLALISRWAGEHHSFFRTYGIERVLLNLFENNFNQNKGRTSLQIALAEEALLAANSLRELRPYIWTILGWLATHCGKDFGFSGDGVESCLSTLITCACVAFVDTRMHKSFLLSQDDVDNTFRSDSACLAVLLLIFSPSKCIAEHTRNILYQRLELKGNDYLMFLIDSLNSTLSSNIIGDSHTLQTTINLTSLTCYSGLPQYQEQFIDAGGLKILFAFVRGCLANRFAIQASRVALPLHKAFSEQTCCCDYMNDLDVPYLLLFLSSWGLCEMIRYVSRRSDLDSIPVYLGCSAAQLLNEVQQICILYPTRGVRWNAAYILCHFGIYGSPTMVGERISSVLNEEEDADIQFVFTNKDSLNAHSVILSARCPSLLPPIEKTSACCNKLKKQVRVSDSVSYLLLFKLLEYVYSGYMPADDDDLLRRMKNLARRCELPFLVHLICRTRPKWGIPFPKFDLLPALGPSGHQYSDIIMEANTLEVAHWSCDFCSHSTPHIHAHKIILRSSCDYLRALFQSGMRDSESQTIKVPIGWEALKKLVHWLYSGELPNPISGCLWDNMGLREKLHEVQPYVELCWLAGFWLLDDVEGGCWKVIQCCLDSDRHLSVGVMEGAAKLCQWKLAQVAANHMAPIYRQLLDSGKLEELDEGLVDMVRAASVRLHIY